MSTPDRPPGTTVVTVERMVAGGDGLARLADGRVAFVSGGLTDDVVEFQVVEDRGDFVRGRVGRVVAPSPARRSPSCAHRRAGCGGCGWMELDDSAQSSAKVDIVREALRRTARLDASEADRLVSFGGSVGPFGWRTTVRVVGTGDGIGFRRAGSREIVPIDSCPVAHGNLDSVLRTMSVSAGAEATVRCSVATGIVTVAPVEPTRRGRGQGGGRGGGRDGRRRRSRGRTGPPDAASVRIVADADVPIGGDRSIVESVAGVPLQVSNRSFFQSGVAAAELLVAEVASAAPELTTSAHVVDLYGGVGLFAATAARNVDHVTVVESSPSACADARINLADRSATVVQSDVGAWEPADGPPVDVVVADPARSGLARPGVGTVAAIDAPVLVLVSCDPVSGARDLSLLAEHGYRCESIRVLDLFPQTHHVETVARYVRVAPDLSP
ncbi:MAG: hypothetical protein AAGD33_10220 [Actinomycetota bacterium]